MKAVIFCGGEGIRLRPLTLDIPKPLVPIQGKPVIEHLFDFFKECGIKDIVLTTCYLKEKIKEKYTEGDLVGLNINYIEEENLMGTANHIELARQYLTETFVVSNGDELKNFDMAEMLQLHKETGALVTIAIKEVPDPSSFGTVKLEGNKIVQFVEKPKKEEAPSNFISTGFYIMEPEVINYIPKSYSMLEKEIFPKLAQEGKLFGYKFQGQWFDTGTFERLATAEKEWKGITKK